MNYKHLYYFWVVAKEGSIARASESLHLTPQTISGQLAVFEETIGEKLFNRVGRSLVLTDAGQTARHYADEIFLLGAELKEALANRPTGGPLRFNVGITDGIPKLIAYLLLEPALHLDHPISFVCQEGRLDNLLADIAVHKLDLILTDSPVRPAQNIKAYNHPLGKCGVTFFAAPDVAARYREGFPQSLNGAPILLPTRETLVRGALMHWFDSLQVHPIIAGEFDDGALLMAFGQAGVGVFAAPTAIRDEVMRQYTVEPIGATEEVRERFYAISTERKLKHPAVLAISVAARQHIFRRVDEDD